MGGNLAERRLRLDESFVDWSQCRLTRAEVLLMAWQRSRCGICGAISVRLVLDHDHSTDAIRGYLCRRCNGTEPYSHDPDFRAYRHAPIFTAYRQRPPAVILGLRGRYGDPVGDNGDWPDGNKEARWWWYYERLERPVGSG
jgi:hypothetical protein